METYMRILFRQGIVRYYQAGFLQVNPTSVDLIAGDTPLVLNVAAGSTDYLFSEENDIPGAWGPIVQGVNQWLYLDYDQRTAARTFGITVIPPVVSHTAPVNPPNDLHWFDTTTTQMKVRKGINWIPKIRIFVALLSQGSVIQSVSQNSPLFDGTQVGINTPVFSGRVIYDDLSSYPIKDNSGHFVTTENQLKLKSTSTAEVKLASLVIEAEAKQNLAAYTLVKFSNFKQITHADPFTTSLGIAYGIISSGVLLGELTNVVVEGVVTNPNWDWSSAGINALLYSDPTGIITATPSIPGQIHCATVIDNQTILLSTPKIYNTGNVTVNPVTPVMTTVLQGTGRLTVPAADIDDPIVVGDNDPRMTDARPPAFHEHSLDSLSDVDTTGVAIGDLLQYDGTQWNKVTNPDMRGNSISHANLIDYAETFSSQSVSGDVVLDFSNGNTQQIILTGDVTSFNITNTLYGYNNNKVYSLTLIVKQDAIGGRVINWPSSFKWSNNTAPEFTPTPLYTDVFTLFTTDQGVTWYSFLSGQSMVI